MAERITKTRECDRAGCRNRKGVDEYTLTLTHDDDTVNFETGELCPAHLEMALKFISELFRNTKSYPDEEQALAKGASDDSQSV